ncbi:hypothetical protein HU200_064080 [Digitaria exilis]|uniref:Uncharacterized protein n=1 Tax=Digitaria exilis TaxID=1010633 RepID=A0A835A438_9POAL|nr:hypothetical protein HU200_064080 [Digitaria exilis]CAB3484062.1 unnamed protein product [Digitaria exilis]
MPIPEVAEEVIIFPATLIPKDAEEWSDEDSGSECETDSSDDMLHGYKRPVPSSNDLRIYLRPEDLMWGCPVCPNKGPQRETIHALRDHVIGQAKSMALREDYKKKWSHHCRLARNMGWSLLGKH